MAGIPIDPFIFKFIGSIEADSSTASFSAFQKSEQSKSQNATGSMGEGVYFIVYHL
ncbi:MAG: hypothetical protein R6U50_02560 [Desulfobacterales bacterium]